MSDGTTDLLLADYELLERRYYSVLAVAAETILELSEERIEYLVTVELPFCVDQHVLDGLIANISAFASEAAAVSQKEVA